jgi:hypothetical protein
MPIHDWTRVPAGTFHFFHQGWVQNIAVALNTGGLPPGYYALSEVPARGPVPDAVVAGDLPLVGVHVADRPPVVRHVSRAEDVAGYARRADRLSVYLP